MVLYLLLILISNINNKIIKYNSIKNIKKYFYDNSLNFDIYLNENLTSNKFLTAEHIFPQCFLKKYLHSNKDMHNIYLTRADSNLLRSNYPFIDKINKSDNIYFIENKNYYVPCDLAKGKIARSLGYMKLIYPRLDLLSVINIELLLDWNTKFSPSILELKRNKLIEKKQGNSNIFIDNPNLLELEFD